MLWRQLMLSTCDGDCEFGAHAMETAHAEAAESEGQEAFGCYVQLPRGGTQPDHDDVV